MRARHAIRPWQVLRRCLTLLVIAAAFQLPVFLGQGRLRAEPGGTGLVEGLLSAADTTYHLYVGNLHAHTSYSDGESTPAHAFAYARDTANVDFEAITDHHDLLTTAEFDDIRAQAAAYNQDGVFVAIAGQEWSGISYSHCGVYEADHVFTAPPNDYDAFYHELELSGCTGTFNHPRSIAFNNYAFSAVGDVGVNAVEVRNESEQAWYVTMLNMGWHLGTDGSQDNHHCDWGNGLTWTVALAPSLTKANVLAAMRNYRTYSTLDRDLELTFSADGHMMGETFGQVDNVQFSIDVNDPDLACSPMILELYENGSLLASTKVEGGAYSWQPEITPVQGNDYFFVKVCRETEWHAAVGRAWSSPIWISCTTSLPSTPVRSSPLDGIVVDETLAPTFTWHPSAHASSYTFQYSRSEDFPNGPSTITVQGITGTSYTPVHELGNNAAYYWRVQASNNFGISTYCGAGSVLIAVPTFRLESEARLTEAGGDDLYPAMLQSPAGIWLVWSSDRDGDPDLFYKVSYNFGGTWCQDYVLASETGADTDPAILQDRDGKIWVAWQSTRDGDCEIYYKTCTGGSWSGDILLTQHPDADEGPSIAQTSDGLVWVLWSSDRKDGNFEIYYMTFDGSSWSSVRRLTTNPARDSKPTAAALSDGSLWVFWSTDRDGASDIYYKIYDGVAWSGEMKLACSAGDKECPSAASTSNDEVWVSYTRAGDVFYMRYYDGGWSGESLLLTPAHDNRHACITQATNGIIWMAYSSSREGNGEVYAQLSNFRIDSGVNPDGGGRSGQPGFTLLGITPNPASGRTTLKFAMPEAHSYDLAVYDIQGRRVKAVAGGFAGAGAHEVVWDGADACGRPVTPGIYFCTLKVNEHASSRKLVVVR